MGDFAVNISIPLIKAGVFIFDIITYPIYGAIYQPWKNHRNGIQQVGFIYIFDSIKISNSI